eukprot:30800-Pelagococcus_subviridis.AAC.4
MKYAAAAARPPRGKGRGNLVRDDIRICKIERALFWFVLSARRARAFPSASSARRGRSRGRVRADGGSLKENVSL